MIVVCVDKNRFSKDELTIGKTYEILSHTEHGDTVQWFSFLYQTNDESLFFNAAWATRVFKKDE